MLSDKGCRVMGGAILALSVLLAVIGWFTLPDTLIVQIGTNGSAGNTMPKLWGLLLPLMISGVFSFVMMRCAQSERLKYLIVSLVGLAVMAFEFIVNA